MRLSGTIQSLTPAYRRDYKNKAEVISDYFAGKDFVLNTPHGCTYINNAQIAPDAIVHIRYSRLQKVLVLDVAAELKKAR